MKLSKKMLGILLGGLLVVSCKSTAIQSEREVSTQKYLCGLNGPEMRADYENGGENVKISIGGERIEMSQKRAASGSYYENHNGTKSFHTKGKMAILNLGKGDANCIVVE